MIKRIVAFLVLLYVGLWCLQQAPTHAAGWLPLVKTVISAYTGPGDVITTNWKFWWGYRAFSSAKLGTKIANICDSTGGVDVTCVDMNSSASTGLLVVTAPGGVTCTTNCTIKTLYDQTGVNACTGSTACDVTQPTVANRPVLVPSCLNSNACMSCLATSTQMMLGVNTFPSNAQPYTISAIANRTTNTAAVNTIAGSGIGADAAFGFNNNANQSEWNANTVATVSSVNDGTTHAFGYVFNDVSSIYNVDGATGTGSVGTNGWPLAASSVKSGVCSHNGTGGTNMTGNWFEVGFNNAGLSAGNLVSLNTNLHAAYGGF